MMFGVLDRYIGRTVLSTILLILFLLVGLSAVIKFVEQLRVVGNGDYSMLLAAFYTLLKIPGEIEIFFPMAALLGALLGLGSLATRSELVVMQASGFTKWQVAMAVMKTAIPLMLLIMAMSEWIAPHSERSAGNMKVQAISGGTLLSGSVGLWAKDGNDFIYIERVDNSNGINELFGINIYHFNDQQSLESIRYAASAQFNQQTGEWNLSQIEEVDLTNQARISSHQTLMGTWKTTLSPDKLNLVAIKPEKLPISGLYAYVQYLKSVGQDAKNYQFSFWKKVLAPFSVMVMMLLALSFVFGPLRNVAMGIRIVTGISFGFVFFLLNELAGKMSVVANLWPALSALLPSLLFFMLSLYLLRRRD